MLHIIQVMISDTTARPLRPTNIIIIVFKEKTTFLPNLG